MRLLAGMTGLDRFRLVRGFWRRTWFSVGRKRRAWTPPNNDGVLKVDAANKELVPLVFDNNERQPLPDRVASTMGDSRPAGFVCIDWLNWTRGIHFVTYLLLTCF